MTRPTNSQGAPVAENGPTNTVQTHSSLSPETQDKTCQRAGHLSSLRTKIVSAFVALSAIACAALGYAAFFQARDAVVMQERVILDLINREKKYATLDILERAENAASAATVSSPLEVFATLDREILDGEREQILSTYADPDLLAKERANIVGEDSGTLYGWLHASIHPNLKGRWEADSLTDIMLIGPDGHVLYTVIKGDDFLMKLDELEAPALSEVVERAKNGPRGGVSLSHPAPYAPAGGELSIFVAAPAYDDNDTFLGVAVSRIAMSRLVTNWTMIDVRHPGVQTAFIAKDGTYLKHFTLPDEELQGRKFAEDYFAAAEGAYVVATPGEPAGYASIAPLTFQGHSFGIISEISLRDAHQPVRRMRNAMGITSV
ncbi:MAG: cache domain-containing protein, partial [Pseudomonadota bacterium]